IPLYLLKVEEVPRDAVWMLALVFVATALPLKIVTGWAYRLADRRDRQARWWLRWPCRLATLPVALLYAYFVFLSQYTSWRGAAGLFDHHAFLIPAPF
ncbi:MAG: hypothetical protein ACRC1K_20155, partial [Planctomycetia bacterium]